MDMKNIKYLLLLSTVGLFFELPSNDSRSVLSAEVKKNCFLSFHSPPRLRFHEVPAKADRSNLLMLGNPISHNNNDPIVEENATSEAEEFPLTSYGEDEFEPTNDKRNDDLDFLPPSDPFVDYDASSLSVDSTDQLIQLFEDLEKSGNSSPNVSVNFIPPYSTDNGNFKIESRSSYIRRARQ